VADIQRGIVSMEIDGLDEPSRKRRKYSDHADGAGGRPEHSGTGVLSRVVLHLDLDCFYCEYLLSLLCFMSLL
jgi:hypothetical protein